MNEHPSYWDPTWLRATERGYLDGWIKRRKLSQRGIFCNFRDQPLPQKKVLSGGTLNTTGGGAATGATGDTNHLQIGANRFEYFILGTQTILYPQFDTTGNGGLDCGMDQTADDGVILSPGLMDGQLGAFKIGTDAAFYGRWDLQIEDVSGTDDCFMGFVKATAYTANFDDFTDAAGINVISGDIKIETILNNAATTTTDTTDDWADNARKIVEVFVSAAGVVTYRVNGAAPTTVAAFTFDDGDWVKPIFYLLNDTDLVGKCTLREWEVDFQAGYS